MESFNKLVEKLSFHVVAGPCNQNIFDDITPKSVGTPVNVKVKFRHKDDVHRGVISVPKFEHIKMSKNLRLINSDQTILSFDFLMDMKSSEKPAKKSQKKVFQIFRPGICLGSKNNNDDDGYPYVPPIIENKNTTFSATQVNIMNNGRCYRLKKDTVHQPFDDTNRAQTMFLGKCKPGGCLDPPFGEERYAYEPILVNEDIVKYQSIDKVENNQLSGRSYNTQLHSRSPLIEKDKHVESKLFDELLLTYPSIQNCNNDNKNILRTNNTIENRSIVSADTCIQSYYKPPRSKGTSISSNMEGEDIQKIIDNEMKIKPTSITNLKSPSRDSIYIQTGCPAEPVLPKMVTLSPIESGLTSFENNIHCVIEQNVEQIKECLGDQNISFETGTKQNQEENLLQTPNTFSLLKISVEKSSITNNKRIPDDIKTSPEIFESIQNNKTNILNEDQSNKQRDEQSIIVIAPARNLEEILTNDDDAEYLPDFYDENGTDRPFIELSESYSNTQYFNQKNEMVDKLESQLFQTNFQKQSSSILQVNKFEIKGDDTKSLKSNHASQSNIINIMGSTEEKSSSTVISRDKIRKVEDFKIENDGERSQKVYNLDMLPKLSITDNKGSNLKENTLSDKDVENRSTVRDEASGSVASVNNIGQSFEPNQESIQNLPLTSSRHSMSEIKFDQKLDHNLESKIQMTTSQTIPVSPNMLADSQATSQELQKKYNTIGDSQNKDNLALQSSTQGITKKHYLEDSIKIPKNETMSKSRESSSIQLSEKSLSEVINDKHSSNIEHFKNKNDMIHDSFINTNITQHNNTQFKEIFPMPVNKQSIEKLNYDEPKKDKVSEKISLAIMELPNTFKTDLGEVDATKLSQHYETLNDMKENNAEAYIKPQLILKEYNSMENGFQKTRKLIINSNDNNHGPLPSTNNDKTNVEIKHDESNSFSKKNELKHLEGKPMTKTNSSIDRLNLFYNNSNKEVKNSEVFQLDFALQSYVNNNKERAFKTVDSATAPDNNEQEPILLFKSKLRANKDEMILPIDPYTDFVVLLKRNNLINTEDAAKKLSRDALHLKKEKHYARVSNELQETLSKIYEQTLIPVQKMLQALKEEVDILSRNQILIREMLRNKSKPARLINVNRRCSCYRK
ncbi:putative uncharacterized protein DDB_G0282133 isoform X1 [Pieris brassicae]|uniref:putative uncharacterized protein DDB_G0282133 isoform X1 n=1 Tax=Pieris brassicae TaxID=7116 RepID=UPI001E6607B5|nr:putative uncharacterized protein DDB_G0282133 isoform X1 [Pieris brassicae]XP_045529010.1 putative uncharacterized protein DDB_G0282133 isoform X1 [Pieris brassicae]XP_045529011.1 putative uncharacterized protein DDB_G0282133 isoform X1 [Pieris brassicae]